jgi:hypothetical protein
MAHKNGKLVSEEHFKIIAELTLQNDERIEEIWSDVIEIKLALIDAGIWKRTDENALRDARRARAEGASLEKNQRQRLRKRLGLI